MTATDTRSKLAQAAVEALRGGGLAEISARSLATRAGVNQALIFYHFGSVSELLESAAADLVRQSLSVYRDRFAEVSSLTQLLEVGRALRERERQTGNVAVMAQLMAGAQHDPVLARAARDGMTGWTTEIEQVVGRVVSAGPLAGAVDVPGLSRAICAAFLGLELYDRIDTAAADAALDAIEQLGRLLELVADAGPITRRAVSARVRRVGRKPRGAS